MGSRDVDDGVLVIATRDGFILRIVRLSCGIRNFAAVAREGPD